MERTRSRRKILASIFPMFFLYVEYTLTRSRHGSIYKIILKSEHNIAVFRLTLRLTAPKSAECECGQTTGLA